MRVCEECDAIEHVFRRQCWMNELTDLLSMKIPSKIQALSNGHSPSNEALIDFVNANSKLRHYETLTINNNLLNRFTNSIAPNKFNLIEYL